jgi:hypothetical protein
VVSQSFTAFIHFLPPLSEVRKADPVNNPDIVGDVRMGEIAAITLAIGTGAILSSLTGSAVPSFVGLVMVLVLCALYETALRGDRPGNPVPAVSTLRERVRNDA